MADRNDNLDNPGSDESTRNPDLARDEDSGMSGSGSDRGSSSDRDENDLGNNGGNRGSSGDRSRTETSGDELGGSRESAGSGGRGGNTGDSGTPSNR